MHRLIEHYFSSPWLADFATAMNVTIFAFPGEFVYDAVALQNAFLVSMKNASMTDNTRKSIG
jgi:hypothetical protein